MSKVDKYSIELLVKKILLERDLFKFHPYLRDGVDVFISKDTLVHFIYLSSRKRIVLQVIPELIQALTWFNGKTSVQTLNERFLNIKPKNIKNDAFILFVKYLVEKCILIDKSDASGSYIYSAKCEKQINFFVDLLDSEEQAAALQAKINHLHIAIFGVGGVGSWVLQLLVQLGVKNFTLFDHDNFDHADLARNAFYERNAEGKNKATWTGDHIKFHYPEVEVKSHPLKLTANTNLENFITKENIIVNAADEPYIGYTSIKLSRYCIEKNLPLLVAGGFDAHLGSLGELIIPGVTPCADCYAHFFQEALVDWKPITHPVQDRASGFGGLCSLSVFSASTIVTKLIKYLAFGSSVVEGGRGELLFQEYKLDTFTVDRNPNCTFCSK